MKTLLDKVGILSYKYEALEKENEFNIFSILRNNDDEVNLHSKFISELLNPRGKHGMKNSFLLKLVDRVEFLTEFNLNDVKVFREKRNIDILITNKNQAVIIENKIYAKDQQKQLERYFLEMKKLGYKKIWVVYLTLFGNSPSKTSLGNLENLIDIESELIELSYSYNIKEWLTDCIEISAKKPALRETLVQYQSLVEELTGQSMKIEHRKELLELLAKENNILDAHKIASNWVHMKWHTEDYFWTYLTGKIGEKYEILNVLKYSHKKLTSVVHQKRSRNPWYGVVYKIGDFKNFKVCIGFERGLGNIYCGVVMISQENERNLNNKEEFNQLAEKLENMYSLKRNKFWLGRRYLKPEINFESFSQEVTLKLANKNFREKYIQDQLNLLESEIQKIREIIKNIT